MGGMWQRPVPAANRSIAIGAACVKSKPPALSWGGMIRKVRREARCGSIVQATQCRGSAPQDNAKGRVVLRTEEHTSELQSIMRNAYDVFCLKKKKTRLLLS